MTVTLENGQELYLRAIKMACTYHALQKYGSEPYYVHLEAVERILVETGHCFESVTGYEHRITAWLHDILEDTALSYNDIKKVFGVTIADAVYTMTEYRGRNRKERKPLQYYRDIGYNLLGGRVKIADRIANIECSTSADLKNMYRREQAEFSLIWDSHPDHYTEMVARLNKALE